MDARDQAAELARYVEIWKGEVDAFARLLEELPAEAWHRPTDLPGWDVHAVAAHTAHLEALRAGTPHDDVEIGDAPHVRGMLGQVTEQGVVARRAATPAEIVAEIRTSAAATHAALLADPPTDGEAPAPGLFAAIGWSVRTLLRNRPLDVAMHAEDVRRAAGLPGDPASAGAAHSTDYLLEALPVVVAKRAALPPGTSVVVAVEGHAPAAVAVGEDGRGQVLTDVPAEPTVRLDLDRLAFLELAGGRRRPEADRVRVTGDAAIAERLLAAMAVTP